MKTRIFAFFIFTSLVWAADPAATVGPAAQPQALSAETKSQIFKIQRDMAFLDSDEQKTIERVKQDAKTKREALQQQLQELVKPLMAKGFSLNGDLEYVPDTEPSKEE